MNLKMFFSYYGSKAGHRAKKYPTPIYDVLIEPFAGAANYSVLHHKCKVWLVDKNPMIAGIWQYLIAAKESEILGLPTFDREDQTIAELGDMPQEARWLIGFWCDMGVAAPKNRPQNWHRAAMRGELSLAMFWSDAAKERIASQLKHIRHWRAFCASYDQINNARATWFVDPPYMTGGQEYKHGKSGIDYQHLAQWCKERKGQVVVCENPSADWLPFQEVFSSGASCHFTGRKISKEALWLGGDGSTGEVRDYRDRLIPWEPGQ